mmetsp:Transcript_55503/g.162157  ORF Transcript_55503/g.162157 Transcript_55503/m.162157 type:complete len:217 (+) Transcript_55503:85-735(+)
MELIQAKEDLLQSSGGLHDPGEDREIVQHRCCHHHVQRRARVHHFCCHPTELLQSNRAPFIKCRLPSVVVGLHNEPTADLRTQNLDVGIRSRVPLAVPGNQRALPGARASKGEVLRRDDRGLRQLMHSTRKIIHVLQEAAEEESEGGRPALRGCYVNVQIPTARPRVLSHAVPPKPVGCGQPDHEPQLGGYKDRLATAVEGGVEDAAEELRAVGQI